MLPFKTNVKIFIIEFVCAVLLEAIYAIPEYGIEKAGAVCLGFLPALFMFLIAYKVKNTDIVLRCLYIAAVSTFYFLSCLLHIQGTLAFMFLVVGVALALFIVPTILVEYFIITIIFLIAMAIVQFDTFDQYVDMNIYVTYIMMYAFASVALLFIIFGVEKYKKEMEVKNEMAREALEAKSNFLANMSHEIRTPMNAIYGMAELLEERNFSNEEKEYIATIKRSSENLLSIINEILDFSKVDSGKMTILSEPFDFVNMLQDVITIIEFRLRDKNVELQTKIDPDIPKELIGDEVRVRQILINLLNNAVKFTNKGTIALEMDWRFAEDDGLGTMYIKVIDTGIGISEENIGKLFSAFGQLDTRKNRNVEGTGLGLAICKALVDLMGGSIGVTSVLKEGSMFMVSVPMHVYDAAPSHFEDNRDRRVVQSDSYHITFSAPTAKVLIVDDNKVNRQVAKELMKLFGFEAQLAESGQEAIDKVEKHLISYDIIFMDHMMPFMDGVEATKIIRSLPSEYAKKVPIIALTANAINGVQQQFLNAGMNDYLSKPIRVEMLNDMLRKWIPTRKQFTIGTSWDEIVDKEIKVDWKKLTPQEIMERLDGIDVETGLRNCAGSVSVYFDLLRTYSTSNLANLLNDFFEKEDLPNYGVIAHSIKGASKNIGAHDVADMAFSLERAANRNDLNYIWDNHENLIDEYNTILKMLKQIFFGK